jgi:hypothetical protein
MALAASDQRKLLQLLGMSGADNDHEALNAVRLAHALVRKHGLNLAEAIEGIGGAKAEALDLARLAQLEQAAFERGRLAALDEARASALPPWRVMRDHALAVCPNLRANEREFLTDLEHRFRLTEKQTGWLVAIYSRCPARLP